MRLIGFSTGALALGNFGAALEMLKDIDAKAVELSALRDHEVDPLMKALPLLDLGGYSYVSVHAPSGFKTLTEAEVAARLQPCMDRKMPIVIHPDVIQNAACWLPFGSLLCIENMDKRKRIGRTVDELDCFFSMFPEATFCLDIGHARQIDSTMHGSRMMLQRYSQRLRQVHISEIDSTGHHHGLSLATILASHEIANLISQNTPIIVESQILPQDMRKEIDSADRALMRSSVASGQENEDWGALA